MGLLANFVAETATDPGTGVFTLNGAATGRRTFASAFPSGGSVYYFASDGSQAEWGVGTLDVTGPVTLTRTTVKGNTAGGAAALNFTGTVSVYNEVPAEYLVAVDSDGLARIGGAILADRGWTAENFVGQDGGTVQSDLYVTPKDAGASSSPEIGAALGQSDALGARVALTVTSGADGTPTGRLLLKTDDETIVSLDVSEVATRSYAQPRLGYGIIAAYYGASNRVPAGWALCDGTNGTPDLRGKVILGLTDSTSLGAQIGADSWSGNTDGHALTAAEMPVHAHDLHHYVYYLQGSGSGSAWTDAHADGNATATTESAGGGQEHTHPLTVDVRQSSVALNYIMWTGAGADGASGGNAIVRMAAFATTAPAASEVIALFVADADMVIAANFGGSAATVGTAPASACVFSVQKNGSEIGTVTVGTDKSIAFSSEGSTVVAGDVISVVAPGTSDASIANFVMTLVATIG